MTVGSCCAYSREIESFGNGVYNEWSQKLQEMKIKSKTPTTAIPT